MAEKILAVRALEYLRFDGSNAEEILDIVRVPFPEDYEWQTEVDEDGRLTVRYIPPPEWGNAPGDYVLETGDWFSSEGGVVSAADMQNRYVKVAGE